MVSHKDALDLQEQLVLVANNNRLSADLSKKQNKRRYPTYSLKLHEVHEGCFVLAATSQLRSIALVDRARGLNASQCECMKSPRQATCCSL